MHSGSSWVPWTHGQCWHAGLVAERLFLILLCPIAWGTFKGGGESFLHGLTLPGASHTVCP